MNDHPAQYFRDHLRVLCARADAALARGGLDHLVVPAGTQHYQVFDDRDYPFAVNPHFKAWLPVTNAPGSWLVYTPGERPRLVRDDRRAPGHCSRACTPIAARKPVGGAVSATLPGARE